MQNLDVNILVEKEISTRDIVVSPRPVWKCRTCDMHGKRLSCPPFVPSYLEARDWVRSYKRGLFIKFSVERENFEYNKRKIILYLLNREKELFREGYHYVFSLFPGSCNICVKCSFESQDRCMLPQKVRPSLDGIGIELSSITQIDFRESVLYSILFLE